MCGYVRDDMLVLGVSFLYLCAEHDTNHAGASPATSFYRQV